MFCGRLSQKEAMHGDIVVWGQRVLFCPEVFEYDEDPFLSIFKFDEANLKYHGLVRKAARVCVPGAIEIEG
jgi:hypothetical protein